MKNILLIVAHPKENSFSFAMANKYKQTRETLGDKVELLDLYREKNQQSFFTYDDVNNVKSEQTIYYQKKIKDADELVFVFPYWWGSYPAILHNFIDWNFARGFAFEYINSRPKGLLSGKSVRVFTTTGAPKFIYFLTGANRRIKNNFKEQVVNFCGMELASFNIYGGVDTSSKKMDNILGDIEKLAQST